MSMPLSPGTSCEPPADRSRPEGSTRTPRRATGSHQIQRARSFSPANVIEADEIKPTTNTERDLVVRGKRLYDRRGHTYNIGEPVYVDMILNMPFEHLPEATRHYITIRAARIFHDRVMGDEATHMFTKDDEMEARSAFRQSEIRTKGANLLRNRHAAAILRRRNGRPLRVSSGR